MGVTPANIQLIYVGGILSRCHLFSERRVDTENLMSHSGYPDLTPDGKEFNFLVKVIQI